MPANRPIRMRRLPGIWARDGTMIRLMGMPGFAAFCRSCVRRINRGNLTPFRQPPSMKWEAAFRGERGCVSAPRTVRTRGAYAAPLAE